MFRNMSPIIAALILILFLGGNLLFWGFLSYRGVGAHNVDVEQTIREQSINGVGRLGGGPGSGK